MLHESQPVEVYLVFNDSVAIYNVEPKVDIPSWNNSSDGFIIKFIGINMTDTTGCGSSKYDNDFSRNYSIFQNDFMGSINRRKSAPKKWLITDEC
jgi:hypothetical protein